LITDFVENFHSAPVNPFNLLLGATFEGTFSAFEGLFLPGFDVLFLESPLVPGFSTASSSSEVSNNWSKETLLMIG
jgi:hypothetical protein